jgi:NAD(P)-dependent dehydrogenase (short-subunit alcohol dehydrogenase family)
MVPEETNAAAALVVTGGGRGIGAQIALRAARAGVPVALIYRSRSDDASRVVGEIEKAGGRAIAIAADIGHEAEVRRAFQVVDDRFGSLGGLVNNAVLAGEPARLADLRIEELESVFRTNVFGAFLCSREAVQRLSTKNGGSGGGIVMLSSVVAIKTGAPGTWVHFAASKGAVETMSLGLAKEVAAEGIRVNIVRCGVIATETRLTQDKDYLNRALAQVPMGRMGDPAEVAATVAWLLSEDSSYVTGATIDVAGGL